MNEELLNHAIFDALCDELKTRALSADDLLIRLKMGSFPAISKSDINRVLHRNRDFFQISQTNRLWSIRIAHSREIDDEKQEFLEVTGIVLSINSLKTGKTWGKEWAKTDFIVELTGNRKKVQFTDWDNHLAKNHVQPNDKVRIGFELQSKAITKSDVLNNYLVVKDLQRIN